MNNRLNYISLCMYILMLLLDPTPQIQITEPAQRISEFLLYNVTHFVNVSAGKTVQ